VLTVDESFYVKNDEAQRTRAVNAVRRRCGRAFVLCGTPAPNSSHDVVAQVSLVDFGLTFEGVDIPRDRTQAQPVVRAALSSRPGYLRHLKANVLELPGRAFDTVTLEMPPVQRRLYAAAHAALLEEVRAASDESFARKRQAFVARRTTLLRLASNPAGIVDSYDEVPAKLRALDELLATLRDDEKVVIWSFYRASLSRIEERYEHYGLVRYDGSVSDVATRRDLVAKFQEDDETRIFLGNPAAAGAGLTLHRAALAIYESLSNQPAHYLQSLDRIHRRGQSQDVQYLFLVCRETIEPAAYQRLFDKHQAARELLQDEDDPPLTRDVLLAELLGSEVPRA
jgi:SNF2 family DNA or RNA helicase